MNDELQGQELSVLEGKDGWLFAKKYVDQGPQALYTNPNVLTDFILKRWARTFEYRQRRLEALGIPLVTLIVPETPAIRADKLPDDIQLLPEMPCDRIKSLLTPEIAETILYPRNLLMSPHQPRETYWPVDPHWSEWGAYLGYRCLMERVNRFLGNARVIQASEVSWDTRKTYGVLGPVMTPERYCQSPVIAGIQNARARTIESIITEKRDCIVTVEVDDPSLPTAVVFMDSFSTAMVPLLRESFRRTIFVSSQWLYYDLIQEIRPDVVIYERAERGFLYPVCDLDTADSREKFGDLRLGNEAAMSAQRRCRTELAANRPEAALPLSNEAISRAEPGAKGLARANAFRAQIHLKQNNPFAAYECLLHAQTMEPTTAAHAAQAGNAALQAMRRPAALTQLRQACRLEPDAPKYLEALAKTLIEDGQHAEAIEHIRRSLEIDDYRLPPYLLMSRALAETGNHPEALRYAAAAADIDGSNLFVLRNLASMLLHNYQWHQALETLQKTQQLHAGQSDLDQYIEICHKKLEPAEAVSCDEA